MTLYIPMYTSIDRTNDVDLIFNKKNKIVPTGKIRAYTCRDETTSSSTYNRYLRRVTSALRYANDGGIHSKINEKRLPIGLRVYAL